MFGLAKNDHVAEVEALFEKVKGSAIMRTIEEAEQREVLEKRRKLAKRIETLQAERDRRIPLLIKARDQTEAAWREAVKIEKEREKAANQARVSLSGQVAAYEGQLANLERELRETADPRLSEDMEWFTNKITGVCSSLQQPLYLVCEN